jgi:hypothetical protein
MTTTPQRGSPRASATRMPCGQRASGRRRRRLAPKDRSPRDPPSSRPKSEAHLHRRLKPGSVYRRLPLPNPRARRWIVRLRRGRRPRGEPRPCRPLCRATDRDRHRRRRRSQHRLCPTCRRSALHRLCPTCRRSALRRRRLCLRSALRPRRGPRVPALSRRCRTFHRSLRRSPSPVCWSRRPIRPKDGGRKQDRRPHSRRWRGDSRRFPQARMRQRLPAPVACLRFRSHLGRWVRALVRSPPRPIRLPQARSTTMTTSSLAWRTIPTQHLGPLAWIPAAPQPCQEWLSTVRSATPWRGQT